MGGTDVRTRAEAETAAQKLDLNAGVPLKIVLPNGQVGTKTLGGTSGE